MVEVPCNVSLKIIAIGNLNLKINCLGNAWYCNLNKLINYLISDSITFVLPVLQFFYRKICFAFTSSEFSPWEGWQHPGSNFTTIWGFIRKSKYFSLLEDTMGKTICLKLFILLCNVTWSSNELITCFWPAAHNCFKFQTASHCMTKVLDTIVVIVDTNNKVTAELT